MSWELIASGGSNDLNDIVSYEEADVAEGQRARLDCNCLTPVPTWQIDDLRASLTFAGVEELQIVSSGNTVQIFWKKGFPWAAVIILALVAVIVIVTWLFFKEMVSKIGPVPTTLFIIGGSILAAAIGYSLFRREYT